MGNTETPPTNNELTSFATNRDLIHQPCKQPTQTFTPVHFQRTGNFMSTLHLGRVEGNEENQAMANPIFEQ